MLRLWGGQVESLFDLGLPVEVRELPADLVGLDRLLADPALLAPVEAAWGAAGRGFGRPTIPIERFVRLMVIKQRSGWGYETLVREVSDSLHLRRFCRIALTERVPDESTIRKLVRRLGPEVIEDITRAVIAAARERSTAVRRARGADRFDRRGGRHPLSDGPRAGRGRDENPRARGGRCPRACRPGCAAGARSLARRRAAVAASSVPARTGRTPGPGHAPRAAPAGRGGRRGRARGAPHTPGHCRTAASRPRPRRPSQADRRTATGRTGRASLEGRAADPPPPRRRAHH